MLKLIVLLASLVVVLAGVPSGFGQCYTLPSPDSNEVRIFAQDVCGGVNNNPPNPTVFTINQPRTITKIGTYHWNNGQGTQAPGTIGLQDQSGKIYGPWQAYGQPGMGGVPNANWIATIQAGQDLPAGTYTVLDSDPSTWAYNSESDNSGVVSVIGLDVGATPVSTGGSLISKGGGSGKGDVVEWPVAAGGNGHYYEAVLVPGRISWDDAKAAAEEKNGHLVTITSEAENEFVYNLVAGDDRYWYRVNSYNQWYGPIIGGYQPDGSPEPAGGWTWVTGEPFSYTNWAAGEPNNYNHNGVWDGLYMKGTENALEFYGFGTLNDITKPKTWNDMPHDWAGNRGYIIEWEGSYSQ